MKKLAMFWTSLIGEGYLNFMTLSDEGEGNFQKLGIFLSDVLNSWPLKKRKSIMKNNLLKINHLVKKVIKVNNTF